MKKYKIVGTIEANFEMVVEADSPIEAENLAIDLAHDGAYRLGELVCDPELTEDPQEII